VGLYIYISIVSLCNAQIQHKHPTGQKVKSRVYADGRIFHLVNRILLPPDVRN